MTDWLFHIMALGATASVSYFFLINTFYLLLVISAMFALSRYTRARPVTAELISNNSPLAPPISILAPAYNEQETVITSVNSFLALNYPLFEVVVINDGSKDETLKRLKAAFQLTETELVFDTQLPTKPIRTIYKSELHPNLLVIDKENGGKADALNVGISVCRNEIFCAVDSDSLLESDALSKVAMPFLEDPDRVIASGGTVRIANGARIQHGRVEEVRLTPNFLVLMQIVEYTRAFLCGRIGWNMLNATLVISGAFGLFSKRAVQAVGGYTPGCVGEDMELILRLHAHHRRIRADYAVVFVPDPVCWTEAPSDVRSLGNQRNRWQRGLADTLFRNRNMIFNPRYGFIGMLALPYFLFVELLGPVIEVFALGLLATAIVMGGLDFEILWMFFTASLLYGAILSLAALFIEETYFAKYGRVRQFLVLFVMCLIECLWYRQISTWWRLRGLVSFVRGDHNWGAMRRSGFNPGGGR